MGGVQCLLAQDSNNIIGQRLMRHTHFLLDDWKPKTNWRARESHCIRPEHPRRFVGIRLEIPGRSLTNRTWKVCPHISQNLVQTTTSLHQAKRTILDVKANRSFHCHCYSRFGPPPRIWTPRSRSASGFGLLSSILSRIH